MLSVKHRKVINHYIIGHSKPEAAELGGFSRASAKDIFARPDVMAEIERRIALSEKKVDMDRAYLLRKLQEIIECTPGDLLVVDEKGRPSLDFAHLTTSMRKGIGKIVVDTKREGGKYKKTETKVTITSLDRINAIKEVATLLGIRETKTKIDMEDKLIAELTRRRTALAGEDDGVN